MKAAIGLDFLMRSEIFLKLLNMSISAGWLVLAVVILRVLFRRMPKWIIVLLWGIVAIRLVCPFSLQSPLSLLPSAETVRPGVTAQQAPQINTGIPVVNNAIGPVLEGISGLPSNAGRDLLGRGADIWLLGMGLLLTYGVVSYLVLHFRVRASLKAEGNVRICDDIDTPFVFGILAPRIYLPSGMDAARTEYVLAHERAHIHRRDHLWKPLGFILLSVYWFNPVLWLAYVLLCRDIERACDEKVVCRLDSAGKKGYAQALLACGVHRRMIMACPVAFGEVSIKNRIKGVLCYKRPSFWVLCASAAVCLATAVCFLTDPVPTAATCHHSYRCEVTAVSTCSQPGTLTYCCRWCRDVYTQQLEKTDHTAVNGRNGVILCAECGLTMGDNTTAGSASDQNSLAAGGITANIGRPDYSFGNSPLSPNVNTPGQSTSQFVQGPGKPSPSPFDHMGTGTMPQQPTVSVPSPNIPKIPNPVPQLPVIQVFP